MVYKSKIEYAVTGFFVGLFQIKISILRYTRVTPTFLRCTQNQLAYSRFFSFLLDTYRYILGNSHYIFINYRLCVILMCKLSIIFIYINSTAQKISFKRLSLKMTLLTYNFTSPLSTNNNFFRIKKGPVSFCRLQTLDYLCTKFYLNRFSSFGLKA